MEHAKSEQDSLKLIGLGGFINEVLVEFGISSSKVSLKILRSFIGNLNGILENGFRDNLHIRKWGRFRRNEASEVGIGGFDGLFKIVFEQFQPTLHEMEILKHDPGSFFGSLEDSISGSVFLTLTHGNIDEFTIVGSNTKSLTDLFDIRSGINTREKDEEDGSGRIGFFVSGKDIKWSLLDIFFTHNFADIHSQSTWQSIRSHGSQQEESVEEWQATETLGKIFNFSLFDTIPFLPLNRFFEQRLCEFLKVRLNVFLKGTARGPDLVIDE
mmetsp:Transcript_24255/g.21369  ORF Transcript_24255/g.21369 Transcript_24255/m.21369 type:complete len:270 (-) Transcript_24255:4735-5544(-)